jgi:hypothetical protein
LRAQQCRPATSVQGIHHFGGGIPYVPRTVIPVLDDPMPLITKHRNIPLTAGGAISAVSQPRCRAINVLRRRPRVVTACASLT